MKIGPEHATVKRLVELQGSLSDSQFAKLHLSCSGSSWGRIKAGAYHAANGEHMLEKLTADLAGLEKKAATRGAASEIVKTTLIEQGLRAVRRAFGEERDRLVVVLAPTGGGKSTLARAMREGLTGVVTVEASETWRTSYLAACHAMLRALGVADLPAGTRAAERRLIESLATSPKLIVVDEGHYFGPATVNLMKAILNQTSSTVVLLAIPQLWARTKRAAWEEAEQLRSRTCALVEVRELTAGEVETYAAATLGPVWTGMAKEERAAAAKVVAQAGNTFGLWATVARIAREIRADTEGRAATSGDVLAAVKVVAALRR